MGCHFFLQGIFPNQELNPRQPAPPLLQADSLPSKENRFLSHQEKPSIPPPYFPTTASSIFRLCGQTEPLQAADQHEVTEEKSRGSNGPRGQDLTAGHRDGSVGGAGVMGRLTIKDRRGEERTVC